MVLRAFPPLEDLLPLDPDSVEDFPLLLLLFMLEWIELFDPFPLDDALFEMLDPLALFIDLDDFLEDVPLPTGHDPLFLLFFDFFPVIVPKRVEEEHDLVLKPKVAS
jgi:hypothetical protein